MFSFKKDKNVTYLKPATDSKEVLNRPETPVATNDQARDEHTNTLLSFIARVRSERRVQNGR